MTFFGATFEAAPAASTLALLAVRSVGPLGASLVHTRAVVDVHEVGWHTCTYGKEGGADAMMHGGTSSFLRKMGLRFELRSCVAEFFGRSWLVRMPRRAAALRIPKPSSPWRPSRPSRS